MYNGRYGWDDGFDPIFEKLSEVGVNTSHIKTLDK
jgi:hypothetical protein